MSLESGRRKIVPKLVLFFYRKLCLTFCKQFRGEAAEEEIYVRIFFCKDEINGDGFSFSSFFFSSRLSILVDERVETISRQESERLYGLWYVAVCSKRLNQQMPYTGDFLFHFM